MPASETASDYIRLVSHINHEFGVDTTIDQLEDFWAMLFTPNPLFNRSGSTLTLASDTNDVQRIFLMVHAASHFILDHVKGRPGMTFFEARRGKQDSFYIEKLRTSPVRMKYTQEADVLAGAILQGQVGTDLDGVLGKLQIDTSNEMRRYTIEKRSLSLRESLKGRVYPVPDPF